MTELTIAGEKFQIDGVPTHAGRTFEDRPVEGLMFNVRAVQATFDDATDETRKYWAYPDTGVWDAERNVNEFCDALPAWRDHGVLAFTVNLQGGGPCYFPEIYQAFDNNGFTPSGDLKPAYADRTSRVLERADALGMVVILGIFYWVLVGKLEGDAAIHRAAESALQFVADSGRQNVLIEIANENQEKWPWEILRPSRVHTFIADLRRNFGCHNLLFSTSIIGHQMVVPEPLIEVSDYVLIHGNGMRPEEMGPYVARIRDTEAFKAAPKPIVWNEDSPSVGNLDAAFESYTSWGYYDQGFGSGWWGDIWVDYRSQDRETELDALSGYQTPPVNWSVNTDLKRAFFGRVAEITGESRAS